MHVMCLRCCVSDCSDSSRCAARSAPTKGLAPNPFRISQTARLTTRAHLPRLPPVAYTFCTAFFCEDKRAKDVTNMAAAIKALNAKIRSNKYTDYFCSTRTFYPLLGGRTRTATLDDFLGRVRLCARARTAKG